MISINAKFFQPARIPPGYLYAATSYGAMAHVACSVLFPVSLAGSGTDWHLRTSTEENRQPSLANIR
jgi:hypothetical protein